MGVRNVFLTLILAFLAAFAGAAEPQRLFIGTYTGSGEGDSRGIYTSTFDPDKGTLSPSVLALECEQPAFLALHPGEPRIYAVSEKWQGGELFETEFDAKTGEMRLLDRKEFPGRSACHLTLSRNKIGRHAALVVANYSSASVVSFPVGENGELGNPASEIKHTGAGPNESRQKEPHPHAAYDAVFGRGTVAVPDLGIDRVLCYGVDPVSAKLTARPGDDLLLPPGSGPRHLALSKDKRFIYVNGEMTSTVCVFDQKNATPNRPIQVLSTLPEGFDASKNSTAEIELSPSGRHLYVSNRGHDSIAVFAVDENAGTLTPVQHAPSGGKRPRFFTLDPSGRFLFACNKESGNIVVLKIDPERGTLTPTGSEIRVARPVCLVVVP